VAKSKKPKIVEPEVLLGESGPTAAGWHSIESFLQCPKRYQFQHIRGIREPLAQVPDHFAVGQMYHAGRARWFANKFSTTEESWQSIADAVRAAALENNLPVSPKAERQALVYLQEYVRHYSKRPLPTPVAAEYLVGPAPLKPGDPFFLYRTARLDDVSKYHEAGGALCVGESKTTSTTINDTVNQYTLHGQTMLQILLWKMAPQGEKTFGPVAGIMLDVVKKGYNGEPSDFGRRFIPITDYQLNWYAANMQRYLRAAAGVDWNADAPRNVSACTYLAGRMRVPCEFRDLCQHGRSASSKYVMRDGTRLGAWKPEPGKEVPPWE